MPNLEAGLFAIILIFAVMFTFFGWRTLGKMSALLHMLAMAFFIGLALFMSAGYSVGITEKGGTELHYNHTGYLVENVTKAGNFTYIIPGGTDSYWLWLPFFGLAVMNLALFIREVMTG